MKGGLTLRFRIEDWAPYPVGTRLDAADSFLRFSFEAGPPPSGDGPLGTLTLSVGDLSGAETVVAVAGIELDFDAIGTEVAASPASGPVGAAEAEVEVSAALVAAIGDILTEAAESGLFAADAVGVEQFAAIVDERLEELRYDGQLPMLHAVFLTGIDYAPAQYYDPVI